MTDTTSDMHERLRGIRLVTGVQKRSVTSLATLPL